MKMKNLLFAILFFTGIISSEELISQTAVKNGNTIPGPPQRTCGTGIPDSQWENMFQQQIAAFLAANPNVTNGKLGNNNNMAVYTIPVIIHVIHGGQAVGTFPNLLQGQLNSQIQVLNDDFAGVGQNVGNYPATAYTTYATNTIVAAGSKDGAGRIKISNTGITFCLALKDSLGNILPEPGIDRVNYNSIAAPLGGFPSKNPANASYNSPATFMNFIDGYIKPNTIWNVSKYMNLWVTDEQAAVGLLGYATFPVLSGLAGIGAGGTNKTDGFWAWAASFGSKTIFPGGTYTAGYDLGRTCTHEIGHWVGLRHIWGDGTCLTDYCNDTPPASAANFVNCPSTYPYKSGSCAGPPSNAPNGEMFMNFMDYSYDCAMYMFTEDQRTRIQTAMLNSPYRKFLGTHGLCSVPPPVANFSINPNPICAGQTATITDMSTGSPGAWSYTMTGGAPATSTLQSPSVTYAAAGVYSITLVASNGGGSSAPVVKTITVNTAPVLTVVAVPATVCAGSSATIAALGGTTYTWNTGATTSSIVVTPTITTTYTVVGANGSCTSTKTISVIVSGAPVLTITPATATICAGNSVTFTGSGATTYTWSTGPTTASVSVSPTITTTYTLTGSNGGACVSTKTVMVTVNTNPTVAIVATPTSVCVGSTATLTASGATTYTWNTGATTAAIAVSPTVTTNYTVVGANGSCTNTKTISLTVSASPTLNINPPTSTVCAGSPVTLTGSGALTYTWNTGATTATIAVSPTVTTSYTITGTNAGGCTGSKTTTVTVNPLPTVTITANPVSICPGGSSTLTATAAGPGPWTYTWSTAATTSVITTSIAAVYSATVTNANGCKGTKSFTLGTSPSLSLTATSNPTALCSGGTATLSVTGATSYTWSTGATTSVTAVTPTTTTTYSVLGVSGTCTGTTTVMLTVNANPTVNAVANPTAICAGSTSTLTASGATTYTWNTGATTAVIAVTPTVNTTYTVVGANGSCTNTKTVSVTVNAAPSVTATANPVSMCSGQTATLTASGATTYTWNTGATTAVIAVTPTTTTNYTVIGKNGAGCTNTKTVSVTVNTTPVVSTIANPATICAGATSTLTASGATTYTWNTGATTAVIAVTPTVNTTYTVVGANGSCTNTKTVSIIVNASPIVSAVSNSTLLCTGQSATLTGSGATTYTWNTGATTAVIVISPTVTTTYTLTGTTAGCNGGTTVTQSVSLCLGVQQLVEATTFGIYPNPNNGEFVVSVNKVTENTFVEVYNSLGQLVNRNALKDLNNKVNLTKEADGVYHVRIMQDGRSVYRAKILKN